MSRKLTKASVVAAIAVLMLGGVAAVLNSLPVGPLCFSDGKVRAQILKWTPLGCSTNQALAFINENHWFPCSEDIPGTTPGGYTEEYDIGVTHFYDPPFKTDVIAYWVFDKNGRLIDVRVIHDTDAI